MKNARYTEKAIKEVTRNSAIIPFANIEASVAKKQLGTRGM